VADIGHVLIGGLVLTLLRRVNWAYVFSAFVVLGLSFSRDSWAGAGGQGKAEGNSCMSQCMGFNAPFYDAANALTQFCQSQCNVGTGAGTCLATADGCCVPYTGDPDCEQVARYDGPGNGTDDATAVTTDGFGHVYVTGLSVGTGGHSDFATIAYDSNLDQLWVARYDGPAGLGDGAYAIATDGSGNVYVTGLSIGVGTNFDYATIKYDSSGHELWVARYNGPGNGVDWAKAIAVDSSGNVYVTGYSLGIGSFSDYATVAYGPNGAQLWVARYNGPANGPDAATAIAIDGSGNVYVTGTSPGSGTGYDYATVSYDPAGSQRWVARYDRSGLDDYAFALATDSSGHVYVTGGGFGRSGTDDYVTIAYGSSGNALWVAKYDGPAGGDDSAYAMAIDSSGNVCVTGFSGVGIGTTAGADYATICYDPNGNQRWAARYDGPAGGVDWAFSMATDGFGNVYVTGLSDGSGTGSDYATISYDSSGTQRWIERYDGPASGDDIARDVAVSSSGNVYVTGSSAGSGTGIDYATVRYQ
jgi:hypothetical protein